MEVRTQGRRPVRGGRRRRDRRSPQRLAQAAAHQSSESERRTNGRQNAADAPAPGLSGGAGRAHLRCTGRGRRKSVRAGQDRAGRTVRPFGPIRVFGPLGEKKDAKLLVG